jgi:hypothetical protein
VQHYAKAFDRSIRLSIRQMSGGQKTFQAIADVNSIEARSVRGQPASVIRFEGEVCFEGQLAILFAGPAVSLEKLSDNVKPRRRKLETFRRPDLVELFPERTSSLLWKDRVERRRLGRRDGDGMFTAVELQGRRLFDDQPR